MKVVILMENSTCRDTVACAHGLSMYIETDKHKILFDMGPDAQFIDNAKALGVDLTQTSPFCPTHTTITAAALKRS